MFPCSAICEPHYGVDILSDDVKILDQIGDRIVDHFFLCCNLVKTSVTWTVWTTSWRKYPTYPKLMAVGGTPCDPEPYWHMHHTC